MNAAELRKLSQVDMVKKLDELSREAFNLRFQHATGQLENTARIREVRRDMARIRTLQNSKKESPDA